MVSIGENTIKIINIKNMKPASQKYLCPDIKLGVCYFKKKFILECPYSHPIKEYITS